MRDDSIVRLSSLRDSVFCMASLQLVRQHIPDLRITWVAKAHGLRPVNKDFSINEIREKAVFGLAKELLQC